jgi:hypothetical protein
MKEAQGPLRLCGEGALTELICAVVLTRAEETQFHLGLRRSNEAHEPVLHFGWHRRLHDESLEAFMTGRDGSMLSTAAIALSLDPLVNEALQILAGRVSARYANQRLPISYGFGEVSATFEQGTGQLTDPDAAFTCATFVLAMLRSVGVQLIDVTRWRPPTDEDVRWQREIGEKLIAWIEKSIHGDDLPRARARITGDIGAPRYRPTDVAGAALFGPDTWPVGVDDVDPRARELEAMLAWSGAPG